MTFLRSLRAAVALALLLGYAGTLTAQKSKLNAGYSLMTQTKYDEAIKSINEGLAGDVSKLKPADFAKAYTKLAESYVMISQLAEQPLFAKQAEGFPDRAMKAYEALKKAEEYDTDKKMAADIQKYYAAVGPMLYQKGFELYKAEKWAESIQHLDAALQIFQAGNDPNKNQNIVAILNLRTYTHLSNKDTARSLADAETQLELIKANYKEEQAEALIGLYRFVGDLNRVYKKDLDKSIAVLEEGRKRFPDNSDLRDALLNTYNQVEDKSKIIGKLEAEYAAGNPSEITILMLANLVQGNDQERALKLYQEAIALNPNRWETHFNIGVYYVNRAAQINEKAQATRDAKQSTALQEQALAELRKGVPSLEKAHELNPTQYDVLDALVRVNIFLNNPAKEKEYRAKRDALK